MVIAMRGAAHRRIASFRVLRYLGVAIVTLLVGFPSAAGGTTSLTPSTPVVSLVKADATSITISWTQSTGPRPVNMYFVYVDGSTFGLVTTLQTTISPLKCGTTHIIQVEAIDSGMIVSPIKGKLTASTAACGTPSSTPPAPDQAIPAPPVTAPPAASPPSGESPAPPSAGPPSSGPTNPGAPSTPVVTLLSATQTSVTVSWTASVGAKPVNSYFVYLDGKTFGFTGALQATVGPLKCGTRHVVQVEGIDSTWIASTKGALSVRAAACGSSSPASPTASGSKPNGTPPPAPGNSSKLYVSPNGSDTKPCTSNAPCATFNRAYQAAAPGATIEAAGGTYRAQTIVRSAAPKSGPAVKFVPAPGARVTIAGVLMLGQNNGSVSGNTPDHLSFDGIDINGGCLQTVYNGGPQPTDLTFKNAHIQALNNSCHLVNLMSMDSVVISNVDLGPMCCNGDAVELGIPRPGAPNPSNVTLDSVYIHDIYDTCRLVPGGLGSCSGNGFGDGCRSCDHVDGLQAFGGTNLVVKNSRVYAINPGGPVGQALFFQSANGGRFANVTLQNNMVSPTANNDVSFAGPGNSVFSGSINVLYNTFSGDFSIYDWIAGGVDSRVVAPGTSITMIGNIIGTATNVKSNSRCSVTAGNGSVINPVYSHNVFGGGTCSPSDLRGIASYVSTNPFAPSLHLRAGSIGVNAGDPTRFPAVDITGKPRPLGGWPDAGAAEDF